MAYKKYIKKGGKLYGPYIYHSRRVDGKVISEYHGVEKENKNKKFLWIALGVLFVVVLIYFSNFPRETLTGRAIVNIEANYQEAKPLEGKLRISLKEGELIPASSKIIFKNNGKNFEYDLDELVSEKPTEGDFYIEGLFVSGTGEGYGIVGEKQVFPLIHFILSVLSQEEPILETPGETGENVTIGENVTEDERGSPLTGNAVTNFFGKLTGTGNVIVEFESEIEGEVSANNTFTYILQEGETAELKPRSVRTDSGKLSDDEIDISIEGNDVVVSTSYSELEEGFGKDYLGEIGKDIVINLDNLNLILEPGDLEIKLIHDQGEIISLTVSLGDEEVSASEIIPEEELFPIEVNLTGTPIILISDNLTDEERAILVEEFGNFSLEVKEAKSKKGFIIVRYELGDYWVEHSYREEIDNVTLESFMERDRIKWLKDIAKRLSRQQEPEEEIKEFIGNYSV